MAQSLVAHMPGTFVDLLRSDMVLEGDLQLGEPVQLGGTNKDQVTDEAIAGAHTWLLGIVSACPKKSSWPVSGRRCVLGCKRLYEWAGLQSPLERGEGVEQIDKRDGCPGRCQFQEDDSAHSVSVANRQAVKDTLPHHDESPEPPL